MNQLDRGNVIQSGRETIQKEIAGLHILHDELGAEFYAAVQKIFECKGKIIVSGMGKSGHIARKLAATFSSTGTPSVFVHPAEAGHGDLGTIERKDIVIAISKSGECPELNNILAYCKRFRIPSIGITAIAGSSLAAAVDILLLLPNISEACPLGLAPTTSTTMTLALGDALAVACLHARDFQPAQFRDFHPSGKLGQALTRVRDVMHAGGELPLVGFAATVADATLEMSRCRFGCVGITDEEGRLVGIFTDGDLRRHFSVANIERRIAELMHREPFQVVPDAFIADVLSLLSEKRIPSVFATVEGKPVGIIHLHDLLQNGFA